MREAFEGPAEHGQVPTALARHGLNTCSHEGRMFREAGGLPSVCPCSCVALWPRGQKAVKSGGHVAMWSGDQAGWMAMWSGRHVASARSAGASRECSQGRPRGFVSLWCGSAVGDWVPRPSLHVGGELQREGWWGAPGSAHLGPQSPQSGATWEPLCLASLRLPGLSSGLLLFGSPHRASPGRGCHHLLCHLCIPAATTPAPGIGASRLCQPVCCLHSPACRPTEAPLVAAGTTCLKQHTQRPERWISPIPPTYRWISILSVENGQGSRAGAWSSSHIDLPS